MIDWLDGLAKPERTAGSRLMVSWFHQLNWERKEKTTNQSKPIFCWAQLAAHKRWLIDWRNLPRQVGCLGLPLVSFDWLRCLPLLHCSFRKVKKQLKAKSNSRRYLSLLSAPLNFMNSIAFLLFSLVSSSAEPLAVPPPITHQRRREEKSNLIHLLAAQLGLTHSLFSSCSLFLCGAKGRAAL